MQVNNPYLLAPNGEKTEVSPENGEYFSLEELQSFVEGWIEMIPCNDTDYLCVLNEEGKLEDLDYNEKATELVQLRLGFDDYIVGKVLIAHKNYIR